MKIMLFMDGRPGKAVTLPGEYPLTEIGEALGGKVREPAIRLTSRLALYVREDEEEGGGYFYRRLWHSTERTGGPCAVVRMDLDGHIWDMTRQDLEEAWALVWKAEREARA